MTIGTEEILKQLKPGIPKPPQAPRAAELLEGMGVPFAREPGDDALRVTTFHLWGRQICHGLLLMPRGMRADFRRVAWRAEVPRLQLAPKRDTLWSFGLTPATLSPFGLVHDREGTAGVMVDTHLGKASWLGFPDGPDAFIWLTPPALTQFLVTMPRRIQFGRFACAPAARHPRPHSAST